VIGFGSSERLDLVFIRVVNPDVSGWIIHIVKQTPDIVTEDMGHCGRSILSDGDSAWIEGYGIFEIQDGLMELSLGYELGATSVAKLHNLGR